MDLNLNDMMSAMNEQMSDPNAFKKPSNSEFEKDTRFYTVSKKKDGSASVKIRLIPSFNAEKNRLQTFVTQSVHSIEIYQGDKKRFIKEVCPKSVGGKDAKCPICDHCWDNYMPLKEAGQKDSKEAKALLKFAPKDRFITNILILEDNEIPDNNGKVFLYEFGGQIQELIKKQMQPSEEEMKEKGLKPFNAWDLTSGRDFRLKLTPAKETANGFPSWSDSFFSNDSSGVVTTEAQLKELLDMTYCLDEFTSSDKVLPEEKLQDRLDYVTWKPKYGKDDAKPETPKKVKEEELSAIPGMLHGTTNEPAVPKSGGLGELPDWMTKPAQPATEPAPTAPAHVEEDTATAKPGMSAEDFMKTLNFN